MTTHNPTGNDSAIAVPVDLIARLRASAFYLVSNAAEPVGHDPILDPARFIDRELILRDQIAELRDALAAFDEIDRLPREGGEVDAAILGPAARSAARHVVEELTGTQVSDTEDAVRAQSLATLSHRLFKLAEQAEEGTA
jgi:DNA-binding winged helix-turn-helix (wHTH) protein